MLKNIEEAYKEVAQILQVSLKDVRVMHREARKAVDKAGRSRTEVAHGLQTFPKEVPIFSQLVAVLLRSIRRNDNSINLRRNIHRVLREIDELNSNVLETIIQRVGEDPGKRVGVSQPIHPSSSGCHLAFHI